MRILIVSIILLIGSQSNAQIAFFEEYAGDGNDFGQGVVQLPDSSYVITGASSSFTGFQTDVFLLCIDSLGAYKWSTYVSHPETDWGRRVMYQEGDGFYVAGYTNSMGNGGYDFYLFKTDLTGNLIWERTYGYEGWDRVHDAALTRDTGVVMVGETNDISGDQDAYIVRTSNNGDTLWTQRFGGNGDDLATSVAKWNDTTFIASGKIYLEDSLQHKVFLRCFYDDGTVLWQDTIGNDGNYVINDFIFDTDTLQGSGVHYLDDSDDKDVYYLSYDLNGQNVKYEFFPHNDGDTRGVGLAYYSYQNTRISAYTSQSDLSFPVGEDLIQGRLTKELFYAGAVGNQIAREGQDECGEIIPTSDGGVMMVGFTSWRIGIFSNWIFAWKIGPDGVYPWQDEVGPVFQLVGQKEIENDVDVQVFPNPFKDEINVNLSTNDAVNYCIVDLNGRPLLSGELYQSGTIDSGILSKGLYLLELYTNDRRIFVDQIIKQ